MSLTPERVLRYATFILVTVGLGWLIGTASGSGADNPWYAGLAKSDLNPPGIAFAIVWPTLYTLMAIAGAWLVEKRHDWAFKLFLLQLAFNYAWSFVFFKYQMADLGFAWIVLILVLVVGWVRELAKLNKPLAYAQIPYIAWLCFAAYLNGYIVLNNGY